MNSFDILYSLEAVSDIDNLTNIILFHYKAPLTAKSYIQGLADEIKSLTHSANSFKIESSKFFQQYGPSPRRINYKEMAIIYNLINDVVYIRRVIPSNTIQDL